VKKGEQKKEVCVMGSDVSKVALNATQPSQVEGGSPLVSGKVHVFVQPRPVQEETHVSVNILGEETG
jgi:hypothetical protein